MRCAPDSRAAGSLVKVIARLLLLVACAPAWAKAPLIGDVRFHDRFSGIDETGAFRGRVAVAVLILESTGPSSRFDWDAWRVQQVMDQMDGMLAWWNLQGAGQGLVLVPAPDHYGRVVEIGLEPLDGTHTSMQECQWDGAAMTALGYPDGCASAILDFNSDLAAAAGAQQAATIFVLDDGGTGATFQNGGTAWAWWGGPHCQVTYSNGGWGIDDLGMVAGHELAHVFHAFDEYSQPGYSVCSCDEHWNGCANDNCVQASGLFCDGWHDVCVMAPEQEEAWAAHHLCAATTCHLGWICVPETCNGLDDDCDAQVDEELGTEHCGTGACEHDAPRCVSGKLLPCDPLEGAGPEICNGLDDDCDGHTDTLSPGGRGRGEGVRCDADGDGYCDAAASCTGVSAGCPSGCGDCDDADPDVHAGRLERCNGKDDDCDGVTDGPGAQGCAVFFADADGDGYGADGSGACQCTATADHPAAQGGDCDDGDPARHDACGAPPDTSGTDGDAAGRDPGEGDPAVLVEPDEARESAGPGAGGCSTSAVPACAYSLITSALAALFLVRSRRRT